MKQWMYEKFIQHCWATDFQQGVTVAALTIFALIVLYVLLRGLLSCCCGKRRCAEIVVEQELGRIVVSKDAVEAALQCELASFKELNIRRILLFTCKKSYQLEIIASYHSGEKEENLTRLYESIRPLLLEKLETFFGVDSLADVVLKIERYSNEPADMDEAVPGNVRIPELYMPTQRR